MSSNSLLQILTALMENSFLHAYNKELGQIDIQLKMTDGTIFLTFKDYGIGIPETDLQNIFEPFFSTKRGTEQRLGLGLYNVFNIVTHVLNGKIVAKSFEPVGTTFFIQFPVRQ